MTTAALMGDDGEFTQVQVVERKGGWTTIVDGDGQTRKVRNSLLADSTEPELTEVETDDDEDGEPIRRGNVFPPEIRATYVKGKATNGKAFIDSGDDLAESLRGMEVEQVAYAASLVLGHTAAYWLGFYTTDREAAGKKALNAGMVRMNLGNRIRAAMAKQAAEAAEYAQPEVTAAQAE